MPCRPCRRRRGRAPTWGCAAPFARSLGRVLAARVAVGACVQTYYGHAGAMFTTQFVDYRIGWPNVTIQTAAAAIHAQVGGTAARCAEVVCRCWRHADAALLPAGIPRHRCRCMAGVCACAWLAGWLQGGLMTINHKDMYEGDSDGDLRNNCVRNQPARVSDHAPRCHRAAHASPHPAAAPPPPAIGAAGRLLVGPLARQRRHRRR